MEQASGLCGESFLRQFIQEATGWLDDWNADVEI